jgi:hypothetical protein
MTFKSPLAADETTPPDRGSDADMERRPGVPRERTPRRPVTGVHWDVPDQQRPSDRALARRADFSRLTPVFGTVQPPRGLAGRIRGAAYRVPTHYARHWLLLLIADRVDVAAHRAKRTWPLAALPLAAAALFVALRRWRRAH